MTVVDCHWLGYGIQGKVSSSLACFAVFGVDVKADSRSKDYIGLEEGERGGWR